MGLYNDITSHIYVYCLQNSLYVAALFFIHKEHLVGSVLTFLYSMYYLLFYFCDFVPDVVSIIPFGLT